MFNVPTRIDPVPGLGDGPMEGYGDFSILWCDGDTTVDFVTNLKQVHRRKLAPLRHLFREPCEHCKPDWQMAWQMT